VHPHGLLRHRLDAGFQFASHVVNVDISINCTKSVHERKMLCLDELEVQLFVSLLDACGHPRLSLDGKWVSPDFELSCCISWTCDVDTYSDETIDLTFIFSVRAGKCNLLVMDQVVLHAVNGRTCD
jgi:hypothetical protein